MYVQERLAAEKAGRSAAESELKALKAQLQDQQAASAAEVQKLTVSHRHLFLMIHDPTAMIVDTLKSVLAQGVQHAQEAFVCSVEKAC